MITIELNFETNDFLDVYSYISKLVSEIHEDNLNLTRLEINKHSK